MLQQIRQFKPFREFAWQTFNALISLVTAYVLAKDVSYAPVIMLMLNQATKYVNKRFFGDLWVTK